LKSSHQLLKCNWINFKQTKKFLLHKIIPQAGFNHAMGRFWPAGRKFDTPVLRYITYMSSEKDAALGLCLS